MNKGYLSNQIPGLNDTPQEKKSNESESLVEDSFFLDFKESDTPDRRQSSRRLMGTDSDNKIALRRTVTCSERDNKPNGNIQASRQQFNSNSSKDRSNKQGLGMSAGRSESQRLLVNAPPIHHAGQGSMKLDMKFGWRPNFGDKLLHQKEAIAIKLSYPSNTGLLMQSMRADTGLQSEIYKNHKSKCYVSVNSFLEGPFM